MRVCRGHCTQRQWETECFAFGVSRKEEQEAEDGGISCSSCQSRTRPLQQPPINRFSCALEVTSFIDSFFFASRTTLLISRVGNSSVIACTFNIDASVHGHSKSCHRRRDNQIQASKWQRAWSSPSTADTESAPATASCASDQDARNGSVCRRGRPRRRDGFFNRH